MAAFRFRSFAPYRSLLTEKVSAADALLAARMAASSPFTWEKTGFSDLASDWMLTHEMVHLSFPSVTENHHWIEEGIATYVEPIARVRAGHFDANQMWFEVMRDLHQGFPLRETRVWTTLTPGDEHIGAARFFVFLRTSKFIAKREIKKGWKTLCAEY